MRRFPLVLGIFSGALAAHTTPLFAGAAHPAPAYRHLATAPAGHRPVAFVLPGDGSVLYLDAASRSLVRLRPGAEPAVHPLRGGGYDPETALPVDLELLPDHRLLVLDAHAGALWVASTSGEIRGRAGMFIAPSAIGRAPGGLVTVWDPGAASVTVFDRRLEPLAHLGGPGLTPHATHDGRLARLEVTETGYEVRAATPQMGRGDPSGKDRSRVFGTLADLPGGPVSHAEIVGRADRELLIQVTQPAGRRLVALPAGGDPARDLGPLAPERGGGYGRPGGGLWVGPAGQVAQHRLYDDRHQFLLLDQEGSRK